MPVLDVRDACVSYGSVEAVCGVSFSVERGDWLCIVGPNGSGKSSLLKAVLGIVPLHSGQVELSVSREKVGYVPQVSGIARDFPASVGEVVLSGRQGASPHSIFVSAADRTASRETMNDLGIDDLRTRRINELSGGQLQRVLLARAICRQPELLILDEPTAGLDEEASGRLVETLAQLNTDKKITILMVTHDMADVRGYANRVLVMNRTLRFCGPLCDWKKFRETGGRQ